jgi:NADP-dependent 3-hydroxy acid dehydrogenase YdfG
VIAKHTAHWGGDVARRETGGCHLVKQRLDSFARAVAFAISQPEAVDVNEILFRPTKQEL